MKRDEPVINMVRLGSALVLTLALSAACGSSIQPAGDEIVATQAAVVAAPLEGVASYAADGALLVEALRADRAVQPGADEVFDFKMVNTTGQAMSVVVVLEHTDGQRWRTSLCVEKQCLLGDGSEPSVTDPVILPPYLEQPFQAHLFVDETAQRGQQASLILRVDPLTEDARPQSVSLSAQVGAP